MKLLRNQKTEGAKMTFRGSLSKFWNNVQYTLFPQLERDLGELSSDYKVLISILELVRIEDFIPSTRFNEGRPCKDRTAIARAFIAKIVFKIPYTNQLRKHLQIDKKLRVLCGFDMLQKIPSESKFSRAFKHFAETSLPDRVHQALIKEAYKDKILGHVVKDSTPLEAREKHLKKKNLGNRNTLKSQKRRARLKSGVLNRREQQLKETNLEKMIQDLPKLCDKGMKTSAQGYSMIWKGYKLHAAVDDHCIPLAAIITSASLPDSEAAIPLASKTHLVVNNFYDLMDAAYDHPEIKEHSVSFGHVPIIDKCPNSLPQKLEKQIEKDRKKALNFQTAEDKRYGERIPKERFNALYKDYHGGRTIYYKGHSKVTCHVMFGVLVMAASTLINLIQ